MNCTRWLTALGMAKNYKDPPPPHHNMTHMDFDGLVTKAIFFFFFLWLTYTGK